MPVRPKKPCAYPNCGALVKANERYCDKHKKYKYQDYDKYKRNQESRKIYTSSRWKKVRELKMKECGGLCVMCREAGLIVKADVVDHIVELKDGGCAYCMDNLQCLCHSCHNKKTAKAREGRV